MKLLITIGAVCVLQVVTVSSIFFPIPINIQTGTTSSSSGQPGQQVTTSISFSNVSNITDMVIYLTQNISRALLTRVPNPDDIKSAADILESFTGSLKYFQTPPDDVDQEESETKSRSKRSFTDIFKQSSPLKEIGERIEEIKKKLKGMLKPKPQTPSGNQTDSSNTTSETQSRKKRALTDFIPMDSLKDAISKTGEVLIPSSASANSSPLDFMSKLSDIANDLIQNSMKEISENLASSVAMYQVNSQLDAIKQSMDIIKQEIDKTQKIQKYVKEALNQAKNATKSLGEKLKSSNCFAQFINPFKLFEKGITCVKNKIDNGLKIAKDTFKNLQQAMSVPSDIQSEVSKCSQNQQLNPIAKLLCYLRTPLQLDDEKLLLPFEFTRRIREITNYFATMRMDLIRCGIETIQSIGDKVEDCAREAILAVKDTLKG
uniref:46 kDa salivary protein SP19 n=1 Tax=Phlebotomus perniciosus TaxID=13204 RepID=Q0ZS48_PHLPE|nr:46 kDa salivary protein SP19 [Phlebotomus perniciosus]